MRFSESGGRGARALGAYEGTCLTVASSAGRFFNAGCVFGVSSGTLFSYVEAVVGNSDFWTGARGPISTRSVGSGSGSIGGGASSSSICFMVRCLNRNTATGSSVLALPNTSHRFEKGQGPPELLYSSQLEVI